MKNWGVLLVVILYGMCLPAAWCQEAAQEGNSEQPSQFFENQDPLMIQLKYSIKQVKKQTNDSTYLASNIWYKDDSETWDSVNIKLRARGHFRRENCYYAPLKLKIKKADAKGTLFEKTTKFKLVLPCLLEKNNDDYVLKEYIAYKLYEIVAPYHFKTRLTRIDLLEKRGKRTNKHQLIGFVIEDIDALVKRYDAREIERIIHPLQQDALASIQNAFFQYLIANTDFSTKQLHNQKIIFSEKKIIPIPYDFDMSGLVNANYAGVTNVQNLSGTITEVTQRIYKGYERDAALIQQVREEYLEKKTQMLAALQLLKDEFGDRSQYSEAEKFITSFFEILENDKKFKKNILDRLRTR
jgi:hypothetical protein